MVCKPSSRVWRPRAVPNISGYHHLGKGKGKGTTSQAHRLMCKSGRRNVDSVRGWRSLATGIWGTDGEGRLNVSAKMRSLHYNHNYDA